MSAANKISLLGKDLMSKFSHGLILNVLLKIKGVIYLPILVKFLTKEEVGELSFVKSLVALMAGILFLNIPDSANRVILSFEKKDEEENKLKAINSLTNFSFLLGVLLIIIFVFISYNFFLFDYRIILVISLLLFSRLMDKLSKYIFQIYQDTKLLTYTILTVEYLSFGIVIFLLYNNFFEQEIFYILYVYSFHLILGSLFLFKKLFENFPFRCIIDFELVKKVLKISLYLFPASYSMMIIQSSDFIIIERLLDLKNIGEYSFAYSISSVVSGISMAITFFWYSSVVSAKEEELIKLLNTVIKICFFGFILITIFFRFITEPLIIFINKDYVNVFDVVMILVVGFFIGILNQIYQGIMYAKNKEKLILQDTGLIAIINLVLNLLFIQRYGIKFAAFSTSLSFLLLFVFRTIYIKKILKKLTFKKFGFYSIAIAVIAFTLINYYLWI